MARCKRLIFLSPGNVEIGEADLPKPEKDEVLVESICSAVSAGTEMLVYRGQFPNLTDAFDSLSTNLAYPLPYGYACAGRVIEAGDPANRHWLDQLVFAFHPHASHFAIEPENLMQIPPTQTAESACFLPNMETAVNLVQDGAPILGERVLVLGQGVVGLLVTSLLSEFPLDSLVAADPYEIRRKAAEGIKAVQSIDPVSSATKKTFSEKFDLIFELSGSPSALNDAIEFGNFSARIVIGSWYGEKKSEIHLGGRFHRSRIKLISSQVSTISPELSGRWDKTRRFDTAWKVLQKINPQKWITHRFPIDEAGKAYQLLDEKPQETIQVLFEYPK